MSIKKSLLTVAVSTAMSLAATSLVATSAQASEVLIGSCVYNFNDTFMSNVRENMDETAKLLGAKVEVVDSYSSQPQQNEQIDAFVSKGVNALIINPVDRTVADTILEKAKKANLPIVFINTEPEREILNSWDKAYYVGARAAESGVIGGQLIAEFFKTHPEADKNGDGILQYILIKGEKGHQDVALRSDYCVKAMLDTGLRVHEVGSVYANWSRDISRNYMKDFIANLGVNAIEAVIANNDDMALGAIYALQAEGYNLGHEGKEPNKLVPVVGVDATADALKAIAKGQLLGTSLNSAQGQGKAAVYLAQMSVQGKEITRDSIIGFTVDDGKYIWVPYVRVTHDNYQDYMHVEKEN